MHNKREHLQGRQHVQAIAGDISKELGSDYDTDCVGNRSTISTSLDESSLDGLPTENVGKPACSVGESINNLLTAVLSKPKKFTNYMCTIWEFLEREKEISSLKLNLHEATATHEALYNQLCSLRERENKLKNDLLLLKEQEKDMESKVFQLWQVPSWFIMNLDSAKATTD